jgi:hypothetical protein
MEELEGSEEWGIPLGQKSQERFRMDPCVDRWGPIPHRVALWQKGNQGGYSVSVNL